MIRFSYYKTANCIASCSVVHYYLLCGAMRLCHFAGGFDAIFAVCEV